jgi:hypothetical protein
MSKTAQEEIKNIVNLTLKPILKELGYRKKGNTWNLCDGELIKVVNVQSSRGNSSKEAKFTINLGIYAPNFHKENVYAGKVYEENVREYDCEISARLGRISLGYDFWWTVFADRNNEEVSEDLKTKFIRYGLDWLESFKTLEDEYAYFAKRDIHNSALIAAYILKKDSVLEHGRKAIEDANPYYAELLKRWMTKRGLTF